jgi:hypothetical protein
VLTVFANTIASFFVGAIPWFNLANHNNHGVDTSKYESS